MTDLNYIAKIVRVFEEKDKSERIHYGFFAEVQVRSPESNAHGIVYTYTSKIPITAKQFGDLEDKIKNTDGPISLDLKLSL